MPELAVRHLGEVSYRAAWAYQGELAEQVGRGEQPDTLLLLTHPSTYTAGRRTKAADRPVDPAVEVIDVDRGGEITWHGPGQLVGYPVVRLPQRLDVVAHVRRLERALIASVVELGVAGATTVAGRSGVWVPGVPEVKIAAIGIRVARGVTMHGFALNADPDLTAFDQIVACGIRDAGVTSLSAQLGRQVGVSDVVAVVERHVRAEIEPHLPAYNRAEPALAPA